MTYKIALIKGDGIGPEVVGEAVKVLEAVGEKFGHSFSFTEVLMGGCATDAVGVSIKALLMLTSWHSRKITLPTR